MPLITRKDKIYIAHEEQSLSHKDPMLELCDSTALSPLTRSHFAVEALKFTAGRLSFRHNRQPSGESSEDAAAVASGITPATITVA